MPLKQLCETAFFHWSSVHIFSKLLCIWSSRTVHLPFRLFSSLFVRQRSWKCIYNVCKVRVRCTRENYFEALIHKFSTFSPLRSDNDFIEVNNELCNVLQWIFFRSHFLVNDLWNILPKYIAPMCLICTHYTCYFR